MVLLTHGDSITHVGEGFTVISKSGNSVVAGIENTEKNLYGLQFHPEVTFHYEFSLKFQVDLTVNGKNIFKNFLYNIAGLKGTFTLQDREQVSVDYIR
jgi:GMP synthase (glutamine-hydrolysing)